MEVYAVSNQKGGVGKTPTAVNLAYAVARATKDTVLLVDMDPQGSATEYFLAEKADTLEITIFDALTGGPVGGPYRGPKAIAPIIITEHIHLLPAHDALAAAEIVLPTLSNVEKRLSKVLSFYASTYPYAVIDCPPSLGILNKNALAAATKVIIPVKTEIAAQRTLKLITRSIADVQESDLNANLQIWGILPTLYDMRKRHHTDILRAIREQYKDQVYAEPSKETTKYNDATVLKTDVSVLDKDLGLYWDRLAASVLNGVLGGMEAHS